MKNNNIMGSLPLESKEDYLQRLLSYFPKHEELIRYLYARFELYVYFFKLRLYIAFLIYIKRILKNA